MPIEIIPKKREIVPPWQILVFVISIIILLGSVLFYLFLLNQEKKYKSKIDEIRAEILKEQKEREKDIKEVSEINDRISTFSKIGQSHLFLSKVFEILSKTTHPKVFYTAFDLNPEKNNLSISGLTENFFTLAQQILLFKENEMVKEIEISKISKTKEGKVDFSLNLILKEEIFKWKE